MLTQSDAAIAAWRATERTLDAKVSITDNDGNTTDYATTDVTSIAYDSGAFTGDTFSIGSTYENNITVTFAHLVEGLQQGYKVTAKIGIKLPDGTFEYCPLGVFIISDDISMDRNNDITTIKCYDQFCAMEGTYASSLTYPAKVVDVIAEIANNAGVELNTDDIARLPTQGDVASAISGQTYRVAIGWIAQFYGGFVLFDRDGKLTIRTVASPDYILDPSQYEQSGLTKNEATYVIGGLSVSVTTTTTDSTGESSETTSTLTAGSTSGSQIELTNNLMTQSRLDDIWTGVKDITFYPFELTWFGNPAIEAGDWLTLEDTKGNKFNVPNNAYTMTFDGGLTATSKADQTSTASSSYSYSGTLSQTVKELSGRQSATGNYIYGTDVIQTPITAKIGDLWYKQNGNKVELWQFQKQSDGTGKWVLTNSDTTGVEISENVATAMTDANTAKQNSSTAVETANTAISDANLAITNAQNAADTANNANTKASTALSNAQSAVDKAQQTADNLTTLQETVDTNSSAIETAQSDLATAKTNIANNANAISDAQGNISSLQTSASKLENDMTDAQGNISTLQQNSTSFRNDISSLQSDNSTNKSNISSLQNTASGLTSTVASVQTQVNNSAVGTNILTGTASTFTQYALGTTYIPMSGDLVNAFTNNGVGIVLVSGQKYTLSFNYVIDHFDNSKITDGIGFGLGTASTVGGYQVDAYATNQKYPTATGKMIFTFTGMNGGTYNYLSFRPMRWTNNVTFTSTETDRPVIHISQLKLEKGSVATDYSANPADNATVTSVSTLSNTVNGLSNTVSTKANQVDLNTTNTQLSTLSNTVTGLTSTVASKANSSDLQSTQTQVSTLQNTVDGLSTTVSNIQTSTNTNSTNISTLQQRADGFDTSITNLQTTKVTQTDINNSLVPYATQTWTTNQISATASGINATITSVQTQVNNSAVGTNLLTGTHSTLKSYTSTASSWGTSDKFTTNLSAGVYTFSAKIDATNSNHDMCVQFIYTTASGSTYYGMGNAIVSGQSGVSKYTATIPNVQTVTVWVVYTAINTVANSYLAGLEKLEKGSVATDWSANPSDNATVMSVTTLSATVQGIQTTVSQKVDNTTYQTQVTQFNNQISTKVESATYNSKMTQLDNAIATKVSSSDYNTEVTQLTNMIDSKVSQNDWSNSAVGANLVPNSNADSSVAWENTSRSTNAFYNGGQSYLFGIHNATTSKNTASSPRFFITPGNIYTLSFKAFNNDLLTSADVWLLGRTVNNTTDDYTVAQQLVKETKFSTSDIQYYTVTFTVDSGIENAYLRFDNNATSTSGSSADLYFNEIKVELGSTATPWCPAASEIANYSQVQQLSDNINLRVQKNDVINQINVSSEGILIDGAKVHITGTTTIDNAVITNAMISSLSAGKLTAGTIDASLINVINLNANNITTGIISGSNLSLNLSTGEVLFQKGSIKSSGGTLDIEINDGTITVVNSSGKGAYFSNGKIYMSDSGGLAKIMAGDYTSQKYGVIEQGTGYLGITNGGISIHGINDGFSLLQDASNSTSAVVTTDLMYWGSISKATGLAITGKKAYLGGDTDSKTVLSGGTNIGGTGTWSGVQAHILVGQNTSAVTAGGSSVGSDVQIFASNIWLGASNGNVTVNAGGFVTSGAAHVGTGLRVDGDFSVGGSKNAIVQTSQGWAKINAYETAEYYFGDMAKVNTGSGSKVKVMMDSLFLETVNTNVDYHVFASSYGNGYAWVSEQGKDYFIIESNVPNLEVSYEVKAKRLGYENTRLEIDEDFGKEVA